jgi:hypothetical protein
VHFESLGDEAGAQLLEVGAVRLHFLRLAQLQVVEMPRRPPVRDVDQQQLGASQPRQAGDMFKDRPVRRRILDGDQDAFVHGCQASQAAAVW